MWRIIGVLLILVGLVVFAVPQINYTKREMLPHTHISVRRPKTFIVPRALAVLIVAGGVATILVAGRTRRA